IGPPSDKEARGAMSFRRFARLALWLEELFPERHLYLRSGGEMRGYVLTTKRQLMIAGGVAATALWMGVSTAGLAGGVLGPAQGDQAMARDARRPAAVAPLDGGGAVQHLAEAVEKRHEALAMLFSEVKGEPGAAQALAPALVVPASAQASPTQR